MKKIEKEKKKKKIRKKKKIKKKKNKKMLTGNSYITPFALPKLHSQAALMTLAHKLTVKRN